MIKLIQKLELTKLDKTKEVINIVHIFADDFKHFEQNGKKLGWHIQLGSVDSEDNYIEVDGGEKHDIPTKLETLYVEETKEEFVEESEVENER